MTATGRRSALNHRTSRSGNAWNPISIGGMRLWVDSSYATVSGGAVTALHDLSGNGRTVSAAGGQEPTYTANDANFGGHPSMTFNGTTQGLSTSSFAASTTTGATIYTVHRCTGALGALQVLIGQATGAAGRIRISTAAAGTSAVGTYANPGATFSSFTSAALSLNTVYRTAFTIDAAAGSGHQVTSCYVNGAASGSETAVAASAGTFSSSQWGIGAANSIAANFFAGQIAAVIIYEGIHSAATIAQVDAYLKARFGQ